MSATDLVAQRVVLLVLGPTATGKTALAIELARELPVHLISVDSAMVYRGLDIGTAKPDAQLLAEFPHALIDVLDAAERYSAEQFREDALREIEGAWEAHRLPVLVGGTMLYFRTLLDGLSEMPAADPVVRARLAAEAERLGSAALHARLAQVDPEAAARIHPNNPHRVQRALEVFEVSGRTQTDWWGAGRRPGLAAALGARPFVVALEPAQRSDLHVSIEQRLDAMLEDGFIEEVRTLRSRGDLHRDLPSMRSVGYRQIWAWLDEDGRPGPAALRESILVATRQLARRQHTWLRRMQPDRTLRAGAGGAAADVLHSLRRVSILK